MLTLSAFRVSFGTFKTVSDEAVQAALDMAELRTDADVLGNLTNEYHGNRAADILTSNPAGMNARQDPKNGEVSKSVYAKKCEELETLTGGFRGILGEDV